MTAAKIRLPPKLVPVLSPPLGSVQYRAMFGGRGSAKSYSAALMAAVRGYAEPLRVLCAREFQVSIAESFHAELKAAIESEPWLAAHYDVGRDYLRGANGTEFIFRGVRRNEQSIKSLAKIDLTIVEEAEDVPEGSWLALEATVFRQPKSELWAIWNPRDKGSPVDRRFRQSPPDNALIAEVNWNDNPFFPEGLKRLRERQQKMLDPSTYAHIWEGAYLENSDAQVMSGKWVVEEFDPLPTWDGPYQGGDFGFAMDPTAAVRAWIKGDDLHISHEAFKNKLELDDTASFVNAAIPDWQSYTSRWDSARPESISYIKRHGMGNATAADKWPGSIEDGIKFIRSFGRVVIHPRCKNLASEFRLYSYKKNQAGDILRVPADAHNHGIDALRYALAPLIRSRSGDFFVV